MSDLHEIDRDPLALNPLQHDLLNQVARFWRRTSEWPTVESYFVTYHENGEDLDSLLESVPAFFCYSNSSRPGEPRLALTLAGLERCDRGPAEVEPFLHLVRLAVSRYINDPDGIEQVTGVDLRDALGPDVSDADAERLGQFYLESWRGMRSNNESSHWYIQARLEHVALENVQSGFEYLQHQQPPWRALEEPEPTQRLLLDAVYEIWHNTGQFPKARDLVIGQRRHGDVLNLMAQVPRRYAPEIFLNSPEHDRYRLTIEGVALVSTRPELDLFVRILRTMVVHFVERKASGSLSAEEIAKMLDESPSDVRRVGRLLQNERFAGVLIDDQGGSWLARGRRAVLRWKDLGSFAEYSATCASLASDEQQQLLSFALADATTPPEAAVNLDAVTRLRTRGALEEDLPLFISQATGVHPLTAIMVDLDHFKLINDTHGHPMGDRVLSEAAACINAIVEGKGRAYRYGGDEFTILLPNFGSEEGAALAERLRTAIELVRIEGLNVTASQGVASVPIHGQTRDDLIDAADRALYVVKQNGRNGVRVFEPSL